MTPGARNVVTALAVFGLLSVVSVQTPEQQKNVGLDTAGTLGPGIADPSANPTDPGAVVPGPAAVDPGATVDPGVTSDATQTATDKLECAPGRNGGATDKGVTKNKIRLASTHVLSGPGSSFLGTSHYGLEAVVNRVNQAGGICGRMLELTLRDDGWDAARGSQFLQNFINDSGGYFALPVVPSSEGLTQAIRSNIISNGQIPVVGTDGMLKEQYQDPYVWPVATATVSTMRVMAKYAYDKLGARQFGIVYDNQYKFGREGARAFKDYIEKKLPGARLDAYVGIQPSQPNYPEAETFNTKCGPTKRCEFVAMLLEPGTAKSWIDSHDAPEGFGTKGTAGAQPLFNESFARNCGEKCSGMLLWTGYNPPIGELKNLPIVAQYVKDVQALNKGIDVNNQFLEGSYLGMSLFVEALKRVGPNLTRARLKEVMDTMVYESDLASTLTYQPGRHYANVSAQAFEVRTGAGGFTGFANSGSGFIADPDPGNFPAGD